MTLFRPLRLLAITGLLGLVFHPLQYVALGLSAIVIVYFIVTLIIDTKDPSKRERRVRWIQDKFFGGPAK